MQRNQVITKTLENDFCSHMENKYRNESKIIEVEPIVKARLSPELQSRFSPDQPVLVGGCQGGAIVALSHSGSLNLRGLNKGNMQELLNKNLLRNDLASWAKENSERSDHVLNLLSHRLPSKETRTRNCFFRFVQGSTVADVASFVQSMSPTNG